MKAIKSLHVIYFLALVVTFSTVNAVIVDFQRTVVVSPIGTPVQNGATLLTALGGIADAAETNPYLLKIEPGVYDLGTDSLIMKEYVDIEGSGELVTTITAFGQTAQNAGTVVGAANAELRFITIENTGGNGHAIAMYNNSSSVQLRRVTLRAIDDSANAFRVFGLLNENSLSLRIRDANIVARGGPNSLSRGIVNRNSVATRITNTAIGAIVGGQAHGMRNSMTSNAGSVVTMNNVHIAGQDAAVLNEANSGSHRLSISHAEIIVTATGKPAIKNDDEFNVRLAFCELKLAGGGVAVAGGGTVSQKFCFSQPNSVSQPTVTRRPLLTR